MNLQENILRIKEVMNIQEQIPDSRFAPKGVDTDMESLEKRTENLPSLSTDDTIDYVSAMIDVVPGLGNLVSAGIDVIHALSYIIRFFFSKNDDEKIENATLALVTLGSTFIPIGGNSLPILARKGIKEVLRQTPEEILMVGKKLGLYNKTVIFLSKQRWKYSILLALTKILRGELGEFLTVVTKKLNDLVNETKKIPKLKYINNAIKNLITLVEELKGDVDIAMKLSNSK
jgi:hypothetical protein